jgi:hypothetical protein
MKRVHVGCMEQEVANRTQASAVTHTPSLSKRSLTHSSVSEEKLRVEVVLLLLHPLSVSAH